MQAVFSGCFKPMLITAVDQSGLLLYLMCNLKDINEA